MCQLLKYSHDGTKIRFACRLSILELPFLSGIFVRLEEFDHLEEEEIVENHTYVPRPMKE